MGEQRESQARGGERLGEDHRVRNIRPEWRNLARGLERVEQLEARFRAEWGRRLEEAQSNRAEAARQRARDEADAVHVPLPASRFSRVAYARTSEDTYTRSSENTPSTHWGE